MRWAFMLSAALVGGCAETPGSETDAATPPPLPLPDAGGFDAGNPLATVGLIRLAHLVPDLAPVRMCITPTIDGAAAGKVVGPLPTRADAPDGLPFRGITPHVPLPVSAGLTLVLDFYSADTLTACPSDRGDAVLSVALAYEELTEGRFGTIVLGGFATEQSACGLDGMTACPEALDARAWLVLDDPRVEAEATRLRIVHAIPNAPAVDICFDPDGPMGPAAPTELFEAVSFGDSTDMLARDPIALGLLSVHLHIDPVVDCAPFGMMPFLAALPIPTPAELIGAFPESVRPSIAETYDAEHATTIFAQGIFGSMDPATQAILVPWIDR